MMRLQLSTPLLALPWLLLIIFTVVVVRTAWLSDDAYISFRTVENVVHGYGLTWNPVERVQVFTHPLWLLLLTIIYAVTREIFYSSLIFSVLLSVLSAFLIGWRMGRDRTLFSIALLILILSKAYVDYATSGLENPLTHLLLVLFFSLYFTKTERPFRHIFWLSLISALGILNRTDTVFLYLPALLWVCWSHRSWRMIRAVAAGFVPLILWELFSIFYFGFPFPNTAYAKAFNTGIPETELWRAGWNYLQNSFRWDPITLTVIVLTWVAAIWRKQLSYLAVAFGILLYLLYVVKIGGDFMSGRFLTAPLLTAVLLLLALQPKTLTRPVPLLTVTVGLIFLGFQANFPTFLTGADFGTPESKKNANVVDGDIADERFYYFPATGLITKNRIVHPWQEQGMAVRAEKQILSQHGNVGFFGYHAGPDVYVLDVNGLGNALLARLPIRNAKKWRVGHLRRNVPDGYVETLINDQNLIKNPSLALYHDKLSIVIRGDLSDPQRLVEIWRLNVGYYDYLLD